MSAPRRADDLTELFAALQDDVEGVAVALLGPANQGGARHQLRWGRKGGLALELRGPRRGVWISRETGTGGRLLALIRHVLNYNFDDAVAWARRHTGVQAEDRPDTAADRARRAQQEADRHARLAAEAARSEAEEARERVGVIAWVQRLAAASVPAGDTPADVYLTQHRGIPRPAEGWPAPIRWNAAHHALVGIATTGDGTVQRVQRTHLGDDCGKIGKEELARRKLADVRMTNGPGAGAVVRLPGDPAGPLLLAEGLETGLSAWVATEYETWVALGPVTGVTPPAGRSIVVLSDDNPRAYDPRHGQAAKALAKAVAAWRREGLDVVVATPWPHRRRDKSDFNDTIRAHGPAAVAARIEFALAAGRSTTLRVPITVARRRNRTAMHSFRERAAVATEPFVEAIRLTTGVGKSTECRHEAVALIRSLRATEDDRTAIIAVPRHDLARPYVAALRQLAPDLVIDAWRGREAIDADAAATGATMCTDLEVVREAQAALLDTERFACAPCALRERCAYRHQRARRADIWICTHDMLTHARPAAFGTPAAVFVDESPLSVFMVGADAPIHLSLDALLRPDAVPGDLRATPQLAGWHRRAVDVLRAAPDGPVRRGAMLAAGLTHAAAVAYAALVWRTKLTPTFHSGMPREERRAAMQALTANRDLARRTMWWQGLAALLAPDGPDASGWAAVVTMNGDAGPQRVLRLRRRKPMARGWGVPMLILDATLDVTLLRHAFPGLPLVADIDVAAPHQRIRQVTDRAFSASMLDVARTDDPAEGRRRTNRVRDLHALIAREARRHRPGTVLVVAQKGVRAALEGIGPTPPNVAYAHHGAVTGRDDWRDARAMIVVGRLQPPPAAVEALAEALTGAAVPPLDGWYPRVDATREMADGRLVAAEADRHPDDVAERFRWQACEAGLVQVIGRGRGGDRGPENPLDVLLLTDVPLPVPVAETVSTADLAVDARDRMLAAGGVALLTPRHIAAAYPGLWASWEAAKKAMGRGQRGTNPNMGLTGECPPLVRVGYQLAGQRHHRVEAQFDPAIVPDPRAWLEKQLGLLAAYREGGWDAEKVEAVQPIRPGQPSSVPAPVAPGALQPIQVPVASIEGAQPPPAVDADPPMCRPRSLMPRRRTGTTGHSSGGHGCRFRGCRPGERRGRPDRGRRSDRRGPGRRAAAARRSRVSGWRRRRRRAWIGGQGERP